MMSADAVEDHAWARIVSDAPQHRPVRISMSYEPGEDPQAVRFAFPSGTGWTFPREVLESGLRAPARSGDVEVWPCGRVQAIVEFHSADGVEVLEFDSTVLNRFLTHTYEAADHEPVAGAGPGAAAGHAAGAGAAVVSPAVNALGSSPAAGAASGAPATD
jgi:hypothetical protein